MSNKDFSSEEVEETIDRLVAQRLLDDRDFAYEWVRSRHNHSGKGRTALHHELTAKGVAREIVEEVLAGIDDDAERSRAAALLAKKVNTVDPADLADPRSRQRHRRRLVAILARRGYAQHIAIELVDEALDRCRSSG